MILDIIALLDRSSEDWIEFSAGQNTYTNLRRFENHNLAYSLCVQILGYFKLLLVHFVFYKQPRNNSDVLFFAVTANQFSVLEPIALEMSSSTYSFVIGDVLRTKRAKSIVKMLNVQFNLIELVTIFFIQFRRLTVLWKLFLDKPRLFFLRGKNIFSVHFWLVSHYSLVKKIRPKLVIVANDHSAETRSLIEVCKSFKIKIAYVQHAEVSERFHSLDFDISFLYGQHSLDIYKNCDERRAKNSSPPVKRYYSLVGSLRNIKQKTHKKSTNIERKKNRVGLLVKGTDKATDVIKYIKHLSQFGDIVVRPHPNMKHAELRRKINAGLSNKIEFSNPIQESPEVYLSSLQILISGNSTMLLEAAILGVMPIYVECMSAGAKDYYGFVKNNISVYAKTVASISYLEIEASKKYSSETEAVQYYNYSYRTPYFGKEAEVVNRMIDEYLNDDLSGFDEFKSISGTT